MLRTLGLESTLNANLLPEGCLENPLNPIHIGLFQANLPMSSPVGSRHGIQKIKAEESPLWINAALASGKKLNHAGSGRAYDLFVCLSAAV